MLSPKIYLGFAAACVVCSLIIWYALFRSTPTQTETGTVTAMVYQASSTYTQSNSNIDPSYYRQYNIPIADFYALTILLADGQTVTAAVNTVDAKNYNVGQSVQVQFTMKGFLGWKKVLVISVSPGPN
jgi:hypothetical protein